MLEYTAYDKSTIRVIPVPIMVRSMFGFFDSDFFTVLCSAPNYSMLVVIKHPMRFGKTVSSRLNTVCWTGGTHEGEYDHLL